jgi:hypothetical protein
MKKAMVYIVWGPSPEWGDGVGVLGYARTMQEAKAILRQEQEDEEKYGPRSWRSVKDCGAIERVPAEELGWLGDVPLHLFIDELNSLL